MAADKPAHPIQGLFDLLDADGITTPDKALAGRTESVAGDHGHLVFDEKLLGKFFRTSFL